MTVLVVFIFDVWVPEGRGGSRREVWSWPSADWVFDKSFPSSRFIEFLEYSSLWYQFPSVLSSPQ